ncbi:hypothetical protein EVAR_70232_1 [Eumeta japonica]|uniref:Uncharacterized protein n=1 Tax=Eumeta variegata TaxID=151549 RepID=A0A4C1STH2_EUMVA|nr:hypothetical protein EVAR_70232_1 [Eumeta japonica]
MQESRRRIVQIYQRSALKETNVFARCRRMQRASLRGRCSFQCLLRNDELSTGAKKRLRIIEDAEHVFFLYLCFNVLRNILEAALKEKIRPETTVEITLLSKAATTIANVQHVHSRWWSSKTSAIERQRMKNKRN